MHTVGLDGLVPGHTIRTAFLCGDGPWNLHGFWLSQLNKPSEHLWPTLKGLKSPNCKKVDLVAWTIGAAVKKSG